MKTTINAYDFRNAFMALRPDNFTYAGLTALFDYLEDRESDTGEELELDVIALCCDFAEYANISEYNQDYNTEHASIEEIDYVVALIDTDEDENGNVDGSFIVSVY
jgi:hypothetical protein